MTEPFDIPFALANQWDEMLLTKGKCATYYEIALWGADMELEACCEWLRGNGLFETRIGHLRAARRPKPPSLKQQALAALSDMSIEPCVINGVDANASVRAKYDIIRRALEALPDD